MLPLTVFCATGPSSQELINRSNRFVDMNMHSNNPPRAFRSHLRGRFLLIFVGVLIFSSIAFAQGEQRQPGSGLDSWLAFQAVPSLVVASQPSEVPFAFEWEAAPLLYSFGMTRLVSPWYSFKVSQAARFTGSIELKATGQLFTRKMGSSYFGSSAQLIGHIPLMERGEYLGLNVGVAKYAFAGFSPWFKVIGVSTLFGFLEFNFKHSSDPEMWMGTIEFRFF